MKPMCRTAALALAALLASHSPHASGAEPKLFGSISGQVRNSAGVGQMGAVVLLLNRSERVIQRALTSPDGWFRFDALPPDTYTVRVSLASLCLRFATTSWFGRAWRAFSTSSWRTCSAPSSWSTRRPARPAC
jgi:hypothetical protein